jgi:hypothetical protein
MQVPDVQPVSSTYDVDDGAAGAVGLKLSGNGTNAVPTSIPCRVTFFPELNPTTEAVAFGFPTAVSFGVSQSFGEDAIDVGLHSLVYLPKNAGYVRMMAPQPPYDAYFPPRIDEIRTDNARFKPDLLSLAVDDFDDENDRGQGSADLRAATVSRAEGLDGFRVWLFKEQTRRRVSVVKTLKGTKATVRLDTVGQSAEGSNALPSDVDVVIEPPSTFLAIPRYETNLPSGSGLNNLNYPSLLDPLQQTGVVGVLPKGGTTLLSVPARITFRSTKIRAHDPVTPTELQDTVLLKYETTVSTDERGLYATVLPPGEYQAIVEPLEDTGYSSIATVVDLTSPTSLSLRPPPRAKVSGHARVADGRDLGGATISAIPAPTPPSGKAPDVVPRVGSTITDATGHFQMELDQGTYVLSVIPEGGTGLPRLVSIRYIGNDADLGDLSVPAPIAVRFTLFTQEGLNNGATYGNASVRIFRQASDGTAIEVGNTFTAPNGQGEILLAEQGP